MNDRMIRFFRLTALPTTLLALISCASVEPVSLASSAQSLKATDTRSISFAGTGRWFQFGQAPAPGTAWPAFAVSRFNTEIDYAAQAARVQITRKQITEPDRERPVPVDQRVDQYVANHQAWNRTVPAPGSPTTPAIAQPTAVGEREAEILSTPQGFIQAAVAHQASTRSTRLGTEVSFSVGGKARYVGWLNGLGQVQRVQTWIDTPVLGDTLVETVFTDYRDFDGLPFPTHIVRSAGGFPVLDLQVSAVQRNPSITLTVPTEVATARPPVTSVTPNKLAEGVYLLTGGTHHSVLIEQLDHLVLVEAPLNETRALALIAKAQEIAPGKPIKYVVNTHVHFDHSGGLRTLVDAGAIVVTQAANKAYYETVWSAPRSLSPDRLSISGKPARFETFIGKHVLSDGQRVIELHEIAGNGHNDAFALAYLPKEKILIEADAYSPTAANVPPPTPPNPYTVNLYQNIVKLQLDVAQIAALHGPRTVTLDELRAAASAGELTTAQR